MTDKKPAEFMPYSVGVVAASVCTSLPIDEVTRRLNQLHPTGVAPWHRSKDKFFAGGQTPNGGACPDYPETHKHFLFNC